MATHLRQELESIDGFLSVERFESVSTPNKFVSLSFWRDEAAVKAWRTHAEHRLGQKAGRQDIFSEYRLRVATVNRDYGLNRREEAPEDSVAIHG